MAHINKQCLVKNPRLLLNATPAKMTMPIEQTTEEDALADLCPTKDLKKK